VLLALRRGGYVSSGSAESTENLTIPERREIKDGERSSMKLKMGFGKCPRCHMHGILVYVKGIKALCQGCLSTAKTFLQGDETGGDL